jgi:pyridoxal phosphate enzyme (YggS family)
MPTTEKVDYRARLARSVPAVRARIAAAAEAAGRAPAEVRLVAVTKAHPVPALEAALEAGLHDLGENRVEELEGKVGILGRDAATWHMIGHVQSRKAAAAAHLADWVHSVDSSKLATRLSRFALEEGRRLRVLAQVNASEEEQKSGFALDSAVEEIHRISELEGIRVEGLMTMAPFVDDEVVLGTTFRRVRETLERLEHIGAVVGSELSMGMTNDLEIAVREGSTMVRVGTALFGERPR